MRVHCVSGEALTDDRQRELQAAFEETFGHPPSTGVYGSQAVWTLLYETCQPSNGEHTGPTTYENTEPANEDRLVAFCTHGHMLRQVGTTPCVYLFNFGVRPAFQRQGYGTLLMRFLQHVLRHHTIYLNFEKAQAALAAFYAGVGFRSISPAPAPLLERDDYATWVFRAESSSVVGLETTVTRHNPGERLW